MELALSHTNQGLELKINLRGTWKNHVTQLVEGVAEGNLFADFFCIFPQLYKSGFVVLGCHQS